MMEKFSDRAVGIMLDKIADLAGEKRAGEVAARERETRIINDASELRREISNKTTEILWLNTRIENLKKAMTKAGVPIPSDAELDDIPF